MTSINAMRLSYHSGLLVCDEARYWNPEWMIFYTPEKIRSIVRDDIRKEQRRVMFMGQTGTSSIGDEWIAEIHRAIAQDYDDLKAKCNGVPNAFHSLPDLAALAFKTITRIKHEHMNDYLRNKYGFVTSDLIRGFYGADAKRTEIKDDDIIKQAAKLISFEGAPEEVKGIFGNSQILAGYAPEEGFRIFYMTERWPVCEEVQEIFIAQGSGRDTCDLQYSRFADTRKMIERKGYVSIDPAKALIALLKGLNNAFNLTAGVGGYPKIIYVDGSKNDPEQWVSEISDCRAKLAAEMTAATMENLVDEGKIESLIQRLIFEGGDFWEINHAFLKASGNPDQLMHFLRGYQAE